MSFFKFKTKFEITVVVVLKGMQWYVVYVIEIITPGLSFFLQIKSKARKQKKTNYINNIERVLITLKNESQRKNFSFSNDSVGKNYFL